MVEMKWKTSEKKSSIFSSFGTISEKYSVNSSNKIAIEWIKKCEESARLIKCSWKLNQSLITPWNYAKKTLNWVLTGVKISLFFSQSTGKFSVLFFSPVYRKQMRRKFNYAKFHCGREKKLVNCWYLSYIWN